MTAPTPERRVGEDVVACHAMAWTPGVGSRPCDKTGRYEDRGKMYCGLHHPDRIAARAKKRDQKPPRKTQLNLALAKVAALTAERDAAQARAEGLRAMVEEYVDLLDCGNAQRYTEEARARLAALSLPTPAPEATE